MPFRVRIPLRRIRRRGALLALLATATLALVGCGTAPNTSMKVGECGFFVQHSTKKPWTFERRPCADPEAVLVVVREASSVRCADHGYEWKSRHRKKDRSVCTHLNVQVGDCINDKHEYAHLYKLRKVPCTTPGALQVNNRAEQTFAQVCGDAARKHRETVPINYQNPLLALCLHRVGT